MAALQAVAVLEAQARQLRQRAVVQLQRRHRLRQVLDRRTVWPVFESCSTMWRWLNVPRSVSCPVSRGGVPSVKSDANAIASACAQSMFCSCASSSASVPAWVTALLGGSIRPNAKLQCLSLPHPEHETIVAVVLGHSHDETREGMLRGPSLGLERWADWIIDVRTRWPKSDPKPGWRLLLGSGWLLALAAIVEKVVGG